MTKPRQIILLLLVIFVIYAIYSDPTQAAGVTREGMGIVGQFLNGLSTFADNIING